MKEWKKLETMGRVCSFLIRSFWWYISWEAGVTFLNLHPYFHTTTTVFSPIFFILLNVFKCIHQTGLLVFLCFYTCAFLNLTTIKSFNSLNYNPRSSHLHSLPPDNPVASARPAHGDHR